MQTLRVCVRLLRNKTKRRIVAIYHLSVKTVSRSAGRSATAASAYRAGDEIVDERTGDVHDYTRKGGVESAELAETRKNSTVAREFEIALPSELPADEQQQLAHDLAREIVARHGCAADVAIHAAGRGGDNRNHHAHILLTTRRLAGGGFTEKTRELDERKSGEVDYWRERFATLQNAALARNGVSLTVDHRSLEKQGIERAPTQHLGVAATGFERRTGEKSNKRLDWEQEASERLAKAKELGELSRESLSLDKTIIDLSDDLSAAKAERDRQFAPEVKQTAASGVADFRAQFEQAKQLEAGKAQARQAFEQFKAEQEKQQVAELARQQHEADAKAKAEQQQKEKDRDHGLSM